MKKQNSGQGGACTGGWGCCRGTCADGRGGRSDGGCGAPWTQAMWWPEQAQCRPRRAARAPASRIPAPIQAQADPWPWTAHREVGVRTAPHPRACWTHEVESRPPLSGSEGPSVLLSGAGIRLSGPVTLPEGSTPRALRGHPRSPTASLRPGRRVWSQRARPSNPRPIPREPSSGALGDRQDVYTKLVLRRGPGPPGAGGG